MSIHDYQDIIDLPCPTSSKHPRMSLQARAAQFAPFAALTGHQEQIKESERITEEKKILDENQKEELDFQLQTITSQTKLKLTYFIQDKYKSGGLYQTQITKIKKIDEYEKKIILENNEKIRIEDIYQIEKIEI